MFAQNQAAIAQLGERQTEDLKVPSSILGLGIAGNDAVAPAQKSVESLKLGRRVTPHFPD